MLDIIGLQCQPGIEAMTGLRPKCCIRRKHGGGTSTLLHVQRYEWGNRSSPLPITRSLQGKIVLHLLAFACICFCIWHCHCVTSAQLLSEGVAVIADVLSHCMMHHLHL